MLYIYKPKILRYDIDIIHSELINGGFTQFSKSDIKNKIERINSLYLKDKSEIIFLILFLYKSFLDNECEYIEGHNINFKFEFISKKSRINIYTDNKFMSFYMPFSIKDNEKDITLFSRFDRSLNINIDVLNILLKYFEKSLFLHYSYMQLIEQEELLESVYTDFSKETNLQVSFADVSKVYAELLYFDTSYIRFDIDLDNSLRIDSNGQMVNKRVFAHPPYHFDSDYRDAPSYKIGIDKELQYEEFSTLFQLNGENSLMIQHGYEAQSMVGVVSQYKQTLNFDDPSIMEKYRQ